MAINFPNSPTNGQIYSTNGITYKYDSTIGAWLIDSYTSTDYVGPAFDAANAAFFKANTAVTDFSPAYNQANAAFLSSNSVNVYSDSTYVKLTALSQTITGDLDIVGDLTLSGNTFSIDATRLQVDDPLIYLASNNYSSDIVDIGFIANYVNATGANVHTGLYREHVNKEYYLFQGYDQEPANNHIGAMSNNMTLAVLNADIKTSNLVLGGQNTIIWINSSYDKANAANIIADLAFDKANAANVLAFNALPNVTTRATYSGNLDFTAGGISFGSRVSSAASNVANHIDLWGGLYGFSITGSQLNYVASSGAAHVFYISSTERAKVNTTGLYVTGGVNSTSIIKSAGLYDSSNRLLLIKDSTGTVVWGN